MSIFNKAVTKDQVFEKLKTVMDPELNMPITELDMVKDIQIQGSLVELQICLTIPGCPLKMKIQKDAEAAVRSLPGVEEVRLEFSAMSPQQLEALRAKIGAKRAEAINSSGAKGVECLPRKAAHIWAITSGKGGVGKSSVTSLLAAALARKGRKVGILDADITGPSIARIFGVKQRPEVKGEDILVPVTSLSGVKVLSVNMLVEEETTPLVWRGPMIHGAIRQFYMDTEWEGTEFLLVDMPPGTSDANLTVFQSIPLDGVILVTSPQDLVKMIVGKAIGMAKKMEVPILGLVENMAYLDCPHCGKEIRLYGPTQGEAAAREAGIPFLGSLPVDPALALACDTGAIHGYSSPRIEEIAARLAQGL